MLPALRRNDGGADDAVARSQTDSTHAACLTAYAADVVFIKADGIALLGGGDDRGAPVGLEHREQLVALIERDGVQAAGAAGSISHQVYAFDNTLPRQHNQIFIRRKFGHRQNSGDLLVRLERKHVDKGSFPSRSCRPRGSHSIS